MTYPNLECEGHNSFKLADGGEIRNLNQLSENLENMQDSSFAHHVSDGKNDFSAWVKDVLVDEKLANDLLAANDRKTAQITVLKRIVELMKENPK
jgi:hypothetical protein